VPAPIAAPETVLSSCAFAARGRAAKAANAAPTPKMKILRMVDDPFSRRMIARVIFSGVKNKRANTPEVPRSRNLRSMPEVRA
jgi:hypothetical protein